LPDAVFFHVRVLVNADAPDAVRAGLGELHHALPAPRGARAVRSYGDDRLELHVVVQVALAEALGTEQQHGAAYPFLADVDAALPVLEGAVAREEIRGVLPQPLVEEVAEGGLQILDAVLILETGHAFAILGETR